MASTRNDIQRLRQQQMFQNYGSDINDVNMSQSIPSGVDMATDPDTTIPTLRSRSIFDRSQVKEPSDTGPKSGELSTLTPPGGKYDTAADIQEIMDAISKVYTPQTRATDRFNELLDNPPERNEPGIFRKIVAGGVALGNKSRGIPGGIEQAEKVLQAPYLRDAADWKLKAEPFQQAERDETTANVNERTLAGNVVSSITAANRQAEQSRIADEKNRIAEEKNKAAAESAKMRAQAQYLKANKWDIKVEGDRVVAYSPDSPPKRLDLGPSGNMDQFDLVTLQGQNAVAAAEARGAATVANTAIRGRILTQDSQNHQYLFDPETKAVEPIGDSPDIPVGGLTRVANPSFSSRQNTPQVESAADRNMRFIKEIDAHQNSMEFMTPPATGSPSWKLKPPTLTYTSNFGFGNTDAEDKAEFAQKWTRYNEVRKRLGLEPEPLPAEAQLPAQREPTIGAAPGPTIGAAPTPRIPQAQGGYAPEQPGPSAVPPPVNSGVMRQPFQQPDQQQQGQGQQPIKLTPEQVRALTPQDIQELQSYIKVPGKILAIGPDGTIGSVFNTPEAIQAASQKGIRVYTGGQ